MTDLHQLFCILPHHDLLLVLSILLLITFRLYQFQICLYQPRTLFTLHCRCGQLIHSNPFSKSMHLRLSLLALLSFNFNISFLFYFPKLKFLSSAPDPPRENVLFSFSPSRLFAYCPTSLCPSAHRKQLLVPVRHLYVAEIDWYLINLFFKQ